jgi:hypothetical protein
MAGITSTFHGESGVIAEMRWVATDDRVRLGIRLEGNPHKDWAYTSGDISIDPQLKVGDRAVYIRCGGTSGIWVKDVDTHFPNLSDAFARDAPWSDRVRRDDINGAITRLFQRWLPHPVVAALRRLALRPLLRPAGLPMHVVNGGDLPGNEYQNPSGATFFLSYDHQDVLLADALYRSLRGDGATVVWFDRLQPTLGSEQIAQTVQRLRQAVRGAQGFVLVVTKNTLARQMVGVEIEEARIRAASDPTFVFIVLRAGDVTLPAALVHGARVIDCGRLSWFETVHEELFAAVYQRPGRQQWIQEQRARGFQVRSDREEGSGSRAPYPLGTSGIARRLEYHGTPEGINWTLELDTSDGPKTLNDHDLAESDAVVVDLGIQPGDTVVHYLIGCYRDWVVGFSGHLYMRDARDVTPASVMERYSAELNKFRMMSVEA